jgi:hypothetical protein
MNRPKILIAWLSLVLLMIGIPCYLCISSILKEDQANENRGCPPLPVNFTEADLVGTWVARSIDITDTLMIRADGTYKQIIHIGRQSIDYKIEWQRWRFEHRENGTGYLHLEGYRTCASDPYVTCDWVNDGKKPWADVCESQWMKLGPSVGEIILVVYGYSFYHPEKEKVSHPFSLALFRGFESSSWSYSYQGP